ncbi:MAG: DNA polymerase III subunit alpha [Chloroflexota bacterium]|nr:MAG: DNA polymerase III subunit alpha [Chloroflexota bacterium]
MIELHCHTNYSLLDGASPPDEMVERAVELGMPALAVTDHDGLYGAVRFWKAAKQAGIKPIIGAEMMLEDGYHLVLLSRNKAGYANLSRLISHAQLSHQKHEARLSYEFLSRHAEGLFCLSGCREGEIAQRLLRGERQEAVAAARKYADIFGPRGFWIELQHHLLPEDRRLCDNLADLASYVDLGCVATNDVHYARREGRRLQDILVCIKHRTTLDESHALRRANGEYYLKSHAEMARLFARYPTALTNAAWIADRCDVDLNFEHYRFPSFDVPEGETVFGYLEKLCWAGAAERYGGWGLGAGGWSPNPQPLAPNPQPPTPAQQLSHELGVIQRMGLAGYFLVVWDIMRYARENGIPGQGRGSAADSIVAYVLGITRVDPIQHNLLFERFLNEEMTGMPDIDIDFSTNHREQIIRYVYEKYGEEHTAMVCNVVTFQARNAIRDVGKVLGFPADLLDKLAKDRGRGGWGPVVGHNEHDSRLPEREALSCSPQPPPIPTPVAQLLSLAEQIVDFPRHLSIHVGGMLISSCPLVGIVPLERATAPGRVVSQWDKDDVEDVRLIKVDLLGLRMLSLIAEALELIEKVRGVKLNLDHIPLDDPAVYDLLCEADTVGVFQVESRAQMQALPKSRPRCFEDIVVEVAIIRPGPLQGNMVHPYLRRRQGLEEVAYPHPRLEPVLKETLGVILFQEQVIKVAMELAAFTPGEADHLRRAMSHKRSKREMEKMRERFLEGARRNDVDEALANDMFDKLSGFASYGFCKSHAAAFARTAYESAYLKAYYGPEFYTSLLNNQPMGFYSPEVIINDARRHKVAILPIDLNRSRSCCTVEDGKVRLGLRYVKGIGGVALDTLDAEAQKGPYLSLRDFCERSGLEREPLENLIMAGAMDCFGLPRRELLWQLGLGVGAARRGKREKGEKGKGGYVSPLSPQPLFGPILPGDEAVLRPTSALEQARGEYEVLGLSTRYHLMEFFATRLRMMGATKSYRLDQVKDNAWVKVGGLVVCRQAPGTAKGHVFLTLEDEYGLMNVILRPQIYAQWRSVARHEPFILVAGTLQRKDGVVNIMARKLSPLHFEEPTVAPRARNFV